MGRCFDKSGQGGLEGARAQGFAPGRNVVSMGGELGQAHFRSSCGRPRGVKLLEAGLRRRESRGGFFREDYPEADDAKGRRNIEVSLDQTTGALVLDDKPVAGR